MATEKCFYEEVLPTPANFNDNKDQNRGIAGLEAGTLLVRPWTTIPVPLSAEDMDKDSEVCSLIKADHQSRFSYPDCLNNINKLDLLESQHRFSSTLSSTSSCNRNDYDYATSLNFPNKRSEYTIPNNSSSLKIAQRRKRQQISSSWFSWGNSLLTALFLFGSAFLLTFLLGLLIGYYINVGGRIDCSQGEQSFSAAAGSTEDDDAKDEDWISTKKNCYETNKFPRGCKPDPHLDSIHGNIMYYVNGDRMTDYISKFPIHSAVQTEQEWDDEMTEHLRQEFVLHGLDKVDVFSYNIVTSSPDPDSPRQLELTNSQGQVKLSVPLHSFIAHERGNGSNQFYNVYSSQSIENFLKASLFFANYGTSSDFNHLKNLKTNLSDQMVLLRIGKLSVQEKLLNAQKEGVRGVFLYSDLDESAVDQWKNENLNNSQLFFISRYTKDNFHKTLNFFPNQKPMPYVYNISSSLALQMLSVLGETTQPKSGSEHFNNSKHHSGDPISVTLKFAYILKTVTVSNVVGTLYGISQPDEQVFVGSRRLYGSVNEKNSTSIGQSGTAMLLELLHSLSHVRDIEDWQPRRTIKFFSWGTATGNDNAGMQEYLKTNIWIVNSRNVGYVDLEDSAGKWCNHLFIRTDSASLETIMRAAEMVPDPANPEMSISMRYKTMESAQHMSDSVPGTLASQLTDVHTLKMSHWVPTAQFSCVHSTKSEQLKKFDPQQLSDRSHHYRHHMAVTRVASLVLLALADKERHVYSIEQLISAVQHEISRFLNRCHGVSFKSVDKALTALFEIIVKGLHPITLKIWQGLTHHSSSDQHLQWLIQNCWNQNILLHRILAPLTRLDSSAKSLESPQMEETVSSPNMTTTPLQCSSSVLTAITQRLEQAYHSLSD